MNLATKSAACALLALSCGALAPSPAAAQDRHYYVCSGLARAERTFIMTAVFAAAPGETARLKTAFARWLLSHDPPYRLDEATVECTGDASLSMASWRLIRLRNENQLYRQTEVGFRP